MNLPIPTTLRGWLVTIFLLMLLFVAYYQRFFVDLYDFYTKKLLYRPSSSDSDQALKVDVEVPIYVAPYGQRWVYVKIQNLRPFPLRNVSVWLDVQSSDAEEVDRQNLPFLFGTSVTRPEILTFEQIPPGGIVHGRLPLFVAISSPLTPTLTVQVSPPFSLTERIVLSNTTVSSAPGSVSVYGEVGVNTWRFLAHSFIEQILLPPWSNGLIVLLVFVVCTLMEKKFSGTEGGESREWWREWWKVFYPSFMLVSFLTGIAFILPCLPWLFAWGEWKGFKPPEIAILGFLWAWMSIFVFLISIAWWVLESLNLTSGTFFEKWFEKWRSWMANLPLVNRRERLQRFMPFVSIGCAFLIVVVVIEVLRQRKVTSIWVYFVGAVLLWFLYFLIHGLLMVWLSKRLHRLVGKLKRFQPLAHIVIRAFMPIIAPSAGLVVLWCAAWHSKQLFDHVPSPLWSLLPILFGAIIVEFLATMIKGAQTLFIPKPSGGRIWKRTGGSRQPREYFRRSMPPRRKSG